MTTNYGSPITGTLTATTAVVSMIGYQIPATLALNSTDSSKGVAFSLDGVNYYPTTPTGTTTGQLYYVLTFPVKSVRFSGAINDTYSIL